jgi:sphingosine kinase
LDYKKILFILNPFSGTKGSKKVYHSVVLPMLRMAGLEDQHELYETEHMFHATELGKSLDVSKYRCAVTISGDGVFHEFMDGLLSRKDWSDAIQLPLGTIGAGALKFI